MAQSAPYTRRPHNWLLLLLLLLLHSKYLLLPNSPPASAAACGAVSAWCFDRTVIVVVHIFVGVEEVGKRMPLRATPWGPMRVNVRLGSEGARQV